MANIHSIRDEIARDEKPVAIPIFQKNGAPYLAGDGKTQCTIPVVGTDAEKVRDARALAQRRLLHNRRTKPEPADLHRNRLEIAVAAVGAACDVESGLWFGWTASDEPAAPAWPPTKRNIEELLGAEHILTQVEAGIDGHSDFFKNS